MGNSSDWSGLAKTRKRPRQTIWIRRKSTPGDEQEWRDWLTAAQQAAKLGDGFPELHLSKRGRQRILTGYLPQGSWRPVFRLRRKRGALDLASALEIVCQTARLLAAAEARHLGSIKPLNRELLFDPDAGALMLCGHWQLWDKGQLSTAPERLLRLLRFLSGRGPTLEEVQGRYQAAVAVGKIVDAQSAGKILRSELEGLIGEQPKNSKEWFRKEPTKWRKPLAIAAAAGCLGLGGWVGWTFIQDHGRPVPNLRGATQAKASALLKQAGWKVRVKYQKSRVLPGRVLSQHPAAHQALPQGQTVEIIVAKAYRTARVPRLAGLDLSNARDELWAAGFNWKPQARPGGRPGIVISSDPEPGSDLPQGTVVTVYYGAPS